MPMIRIFLLPVLLLVAVSCEKTDDGRGAAEGDKSGAALPADNTGKNERDRAIAALTPGDQGGSEADRTVTQRVRQGVVESDSLSINGKNVKIITVDGVVTLRGPVKSDQEKSQIAAIAQRVDGVKRVDNQLEIAAN
jgi:hyperosmotically inducible protein